MTRVKQVHKLETFPNYVHSTEVLGREGWSSSQAVLRLVATWWPQGVTSSWVYWSSILLQNWTPNCHSSSILEVFFLFTGMQEAQPFSEELQAVVAHGASLTRHWRELAIQPNLNARESKKCSLAMCPPEFYFYGKRERLWRVDRSLCHT